MGKLSTDGMIDGGLDIIKSSCVLLTVCTAEPANFAAIASSKLASVVVDTTDFTIANGDISGRKVTVATQIDMSITATGTATHIVLDDGVGEYVVTTCTSQALTSGGTVTTPAFDIEIADPT